METVRVQSAVLQEAKPAVRAAAEPKKAAPVKVVHDDSASEKAAEKVQQADAKTAARVAAQLNRQFGDREMRFVVRDPNKTSANNVIIEVREGGEVVATLPSKEVLAMADKLDDAGSIPEVRGALLDQHG